MEDKQRTIRSRRGDAPGAVPYRHGVGRCAGPEAGNSAAWTDSSAGTDTLNRLESATLLGGADKVGIHHDGEVYVLRKTRNNKLLLTK